MNREITTFEDPATLSRNKGLGLRDYELTAKRALFAMGCTMEYQFNGIAGDVSGLQELIRCHPNFLRSKFIQLNLLRPSSVSVFPNSLFRYVSDQ